VITVTALPESLDLEKYSLSVTTVTADTPSLVEDTVFVAPAFC
jgi:hypothetical protein